MKQLLIILISVTFLLSCEKDIPLTESSIHPDSLEEVLKLENPARISSSAFAFVGNHRSFESPESDLDLQYVVALPDGATDLQLFVTDSLKYADSLNAYARINWSQETDRDLPLFRVNMRMRRVNHYARFMYRMDDSVFVTTPISVRGNLLQSTSIKASDLRIVDGSDGFLKFFWPSVPAADLYLIQLRDLTGSIFMSLTVNRNSFSFYDLRTTIENFTPELRNPELIEGNEYTFEVYAISKTNWLLAYGEKGFVAP